ncbi:M23 family metallopeptidase [Aureispira sp. CCB-E]|uniref:M23 family metallopeptidase n=1 Tax=Aureispira sp. CCB-E TaxID=3051121 RepID=UPI0028687BA4|nr:M23 family metallopeptidase [Aureispira sp. CCB-E]WMX15407.1 M23 family metallopeptidase [Aureispira sp. CCB-E]
MVKPKQKSFLTKLLTGIGMVFILIACSENKTTTTEVDPVLDPSQTIKKDTLSKWERYFLTYPSYRCDGFDFPVGKPDGKGYYNAQPFRKNDHLGDDWNAVAGGDSDLGDPIYSIANGYVVFAKDIGSGWGKIVRVMHQLDDTTYVEALYAHCDSMLVQSNQGVKRGQQIATIGNANGAYYAHLHLEIRDSVEMEVGGGYSSYYNGYLDPTEFIKAHRP